MHVSSGLCSGRRDISSERIRWNHARGRAERRLPSYLERGSRNDSPASVAVLFAGFVSKRASRHWLMTMSLLLSSLLTLVAAVTPR
ncbi:hypothetical protein CH72_1666 [Burkholderia ambifaria AMMD]|jgi:hypothetical protein|uniref:Uncharacterized protein n=1 Tax=Burkholderia ambifaria (strain ATCC BAA-244 / DSM 16087 / CCUG 44356 / LMG 19182 / AMMD) TaxID=339670 RepID=Q0BAZ6_BURCM|nr:hypothetical protein Bamb_3121 [Burkholderia ambifaria AMMD]AJY23136.1 hypothetical protein CH72_1666 [Burkholderia ambifaria AMMD]PEH67173.1 hypothetical protein CRM91_33970 [Burkholderia ambifaria]